MTAHGNLANPELSSQRNLSSFPCQEAAANLG